MFNIGDLIIYSTHGICHIDDICEKTYFGETKMYYVLHPLENTNLTIQTPINNDKVVMQEIVHEKEAIEILESFKEPGFPWEENHHRRPKVYSDTVKNGNLKDISKIIKTLMTKKYEAEMQEKKLPYEDSKLLNFLQDILFNELAMALTTTYEEIEQRVNKLVRN
ncbi:CarD family transcriptional regulator [Bacillus sp. SA1-12]|uniref:CarD family transcriptional regulator n=1 Tax=Bacillus sp. SA1-12 TaxID=1455638 RepID=UPI0006266DE4|nr:CarD family transcriptional regulator [Bacillus sp. SA1-12]KKI92892.1 CarD family transcriptional regulator [Bacillus sp. SA1-12]